MKAIEILITPEIAKKTLEQNTNNRQFRRATVAAYAAAMSSGLWIENGEPIIIGNDNILIDGQHRLMAIIESGSTQKMLVVSGVSPMARTTIDCGVRRTPVDVLKMEGIPWAGVVASMMNGLISVTAGTRIYTGATPKDLMINAYIEMEEDILFVCRATSKACDSSTVTWNASWWSASVLICKRVFGEEYVNSCIETMSGYNVEQDSPAARALRAALKVGRKDVKKAFNDTLQLVMMMASNKNIRNSAAQSCRAAFVRGLGPAGSDLIKWRVVR